MDAIDRGAHRADRRSRLLVVGLLRQFQSPPPTRRRGALDDSRFHSLDWHSAHLLAVAIGILLLSVADAFLTLVLLQAGAAEMNPIMALLVYRSVAAFAALKIGHDRA